MVEDAMVREHGQSDSSACPPSGLLLQHVMQKQGLTDEQCEELLWHVARCNRCADLYEAMCDANAARLKQAAKAKGIRQPKPVYTLTPEEALAKIWRRINAYEATERRKWNRTFIFRIGKIAAAACLVVVIAIGCMMMHKSDSAHSQAPIAPSKGNEPAVFAELVTSHGREPLAMNRAVRRAHEALLAEREQAILYAELTERRNVIEGQIAFMYSRFPFANMEIEGLAKEILQDEEATVLLMAKVQERVEKRLDDWGARNWKTLPKDFEAMVANCTVATISNVTPKSDGIAARDGISDDMSQRVPPALQIQSNGNKSVWVVLGVLSLLVVGCVVGINVWRSRLGSAIINHKE